MKTIDSTIRTHAKGFTLLEMLISILLIGIVMALVIGGALAVTKAARGAADRAVIGNVKTGLVQFEQEFGFVPPLVKERAVPASQPVSATPERRIITYNLSLGADQTALRVPTLAPTPTNPLLDNRYSELSLAYFLAGGLEEKLNATNPNAPPIDGFVGPGLYAPTRDGTFEIPADIKRGTAAAGGVSNRAGKSYKPFVNLGNSLKLIAEGTDPRYVRLQDRTGAPIRYYRWLSGREEPAGSGRYVVELPADLNIPPMVARDYSLNQFRFMKRRPGRDISEGAALKGATWAIVAAGPNGVFGDEEASEMTIEQMAVKLGIPGAAGAASPAARELEIRAIAEEDNIVEVGQ